jgi:hypothetical protein
MAWLSICAVVSLVVTSRGSQSKQQEYAREDFPLARYF